MVSDDQVNARGRKVRCRKCGHTISLNRPDTSGVVAYSSLKPEAPQRSDLGSALGAGDLTDAPGDGGLLGADQDEIGSMVDMALGGEPAEAKPAPEEVEEAVQMPPDEVSAEEEALEDAPPAFSPPTIQEDGWYVVLGEEQQVGPLSISAIRRHWNAGEIGPDSLCWREQMSDWVPISSVKALASALAPDLGKPIVVAGATWGGSRQSSNPVQLSDSGFHNQSQSTGEGGPSPSGNVGWKPSAATALASLVKDELSVLGKPSTSEPEDKTPFISAASVPPENPYRQIPVTSYQPPQPVSSGGNRGVIIGLAVGLGFVALALVGVVAWQMTRPSAVVVTPPIAVPPVVQQTKPEPEPTPPGADAGTAVAATTPTPAPPPAIVTTPEPKARPTETNARRERPPPPARTPTREATREPTRETVREEPKPRPSSGAAAPDDFDSVFGGAPKPAPKPAAEDRPRGGGYVPPPPGGGDVRESLSVTDVYELAVANKGTLQGCVAEQYKRDPNTKGPIVLRIKILTTGKVTDVSVVTEDLKNSYLGSCVSGAIRTWNFPRHLVQGDAIPFSFSFKKPGS